MIHDVVVAAVSAAAGAVATHCCAIWRKPKAAWEPFEPGVCSDLPEHVWCTREFPGMRTFVCPKCCGAQPPKQPPFCDERGGHFHFKCCKCAYEWAMKPADYKPPAAKTEAKKEEPKKEEAPPAK